MKTAFLGTDQFAATVLDALADSEHRPALVVSPPPSRSGRGRRRQALPTAVRARELELPLMENPDVNSTEVAERLDGLNPDVVCLCSFGQLVGEEMLRSHRFLNVHPSLVPRWRGAAPIERAIMEGDRETGVTVMELVGELDAGPVVRGVTRRVEIAGRDDFGTLSTRLASEGGLALVEALDLLDAGRLETEPQASTGITYAEKITAEDRRLDPGLPAVELERRVRALTPHIGAYVALAGDERLGVTSVREAESPAPAGRLLADEGRLLLGCADGAIELLEVKPPGGRAMSASEFLNGHEVPSTAEPAG